MHARTAGETAATRPSPHGASQPTPSTQTSSDVRRERATRVVIGAKIANACGDAAAIALAMLAAYLLGDVSSLDSHGPTAYVVTAVAAIPVLLLVFARYGLYTSRRVAGRLQEFRGVFHALVIGMAVLGLIAYALDIDVARRWVLLTFLFALPLVTLERSVFRHAFMTLRRKGRFTRRVVIIGANAEGRSIAEMLTSKPHLGYTVAGFVDDVARSNGIEVLGTTDMALDAIVRTGSTGAIVATTSLDIERTNRIVRELLDAGVYVELSSSLRDIASNRLFVRPLGEFPVVFLEPTRRNGWRAVAKRAFDVVGAAFALLVFAPLMAVVAIAIKLDSKGPVIFKQVRVGRHGVPFTMCKFRTMCVDAELRLPELEALNDADGALFKMRDDPRVTRVGKFLRSFSIDELPQFWNVLKGDMSLVGPRPALPTEAMRWDDKVRQRLRVKPGLTGMWQVHGRSNASFENYSRLDLYYVDNWSLITDLAILCKTVPVVLARHGAY